MDQETVVYIYNVILFTCKRVEDPVLCDNINETGGMMLSEMSHMEKDT